MHFGGVEGVGDVRPEAPDPLGPGIIGKAAALILVYLGAGYVHGVLMSDLAVDVFKQNHLPYSYTKHVPRINCKTEEILLDIYSPETAYKILSERANRN